MKFSLANLAARLMLARHGRTVRHRHLHAISRCIDELRRTRRIRSLAAAVVFNGEPVLTRGFGRGHDSRPVGEETIFGLGSITESMTAAATLLLARNGSLSLESNLADLGFDLPGKQAITVQHLLTHTSGIPQCLSSLHPFNPNRPVAAMTLIESFARHQPAWLPPGMQREHSGMNYLLLAEIIRDVSGTSYKTFMEEHIFSPLGMSCTRISFPRAGDPLSVVCPVAGPHCHPSWFRGSGCMFSNLRDLRRWNRELVEPRHLDREIVNAMTEAAQLRDGRQLVQAPAQPPEAPGAGAATTSYGQGLVIRLDPSFGVWENPYTQPRIGYTTRNALYFRGQDVLEVSLFTDTDQPGTNEALAATSDLAARKILNG